MTYLVAIPVYSHTDSIEGFPLVHSLIFLMTTILTGMTWNFKVFFIFLRWILRLNILSCLLTTCVSSVENYMFICPLIKWSCFSYSFFFSFLYILDINALSDVLLARIFIPFYKPPLHSPASSTAQTFNFMRFYWLIVRFIYWTTSILFRKFLPIHTSWSFSYIFLLWFMSFMSYIRIFDSFCVEKTPWQWSLLQSKTPHWIWLTGLQV